MINDGDDGDSHDGDDDGDSDDPDDGRQVGSKFQPCQTSIPVDQMMKAPEQTEGPLRGARNSRQGGAKN